MPSKSRTTSAKARPAAVEATPVSEWKKSATPAGNPPMELPSGKFMQIRKVGFQAFLRTGMVPNSLMAIVQSSIDRGVAPEKELSKIMDDPKKLDDMLVMVDDVVVFVAMSPEVNKVPDKGTARSDDLLYVDELDDDDKMYIFGVATGDTADVATFRGEQAKRMAVVQRS